MWRKIIALCIILCSFLVSWVWMDYKKFLNDPIQLTTNSLLYTVKSGVTFKQIALDLVESGVLEYPWYFIVLSRITDQAHKVKTGEFQIKPGMKPEELLNLLTKGEVVQHSITLVEGWTFKQMMAAIKANDQIKQTLDVSDEMLVVKKLSLEGGYATGWFYPDTYYFPKTFSDFSLLKRMHKIMLRELNKAWQSKDKNSPIKKPFDAIILASIIEKESGKKSERKKISGVFSRRLIKRMRLQSDPTVIFGLGDRYDGNIRKRDLRGDTPYNTYVHYGLPPSPIANPGKNSIIAALHPAPGKSLYFVADGTGGHYFSSTLREHNNAVRKYILGKK